MGKMLVFLLGLGVLLGVGYKYFMGEAHNAVVQAQTSGPSAPKKTLDNVRQAAKRIEVQGQQQADRAAQGTGE